MSKWGCTLQEEEEPYYFLQQMVLKLKSMVQKNSSVFAEAA